MSSPSTIRMKVCNEINWRILYSLSNWIKKRTRAKDEPNEKEGNETAKFKLVKSSLYIWLKLIVPSVDCLLIPVLAYFAPFIDDNHICSLGSINYQQTISNEMMKEKREKTDKINYYVKFSALYYQLYFTSCCRIKCQFI